MEGLINSYFQTASGFSFAAGLPPLMCSSRIVATSASVTFEYQVPPDRRRRSVPARKGPDTRSR